MQAVDFFFTDDVLRKIFSFESELSDRLVSRENSRLEFKESFNLGSADDYAKTAGAFANAQGGYIVFGVKDQPRQLLGLKSNNFESLDPGKLTLALSERFSPEIAWEAFVWEIRGYKVGLLYFGEASQKPVVCTRSGGSLKQGTIYYRYRGRSEAIRYPELRRLLDEEKTKERDLWLKQLKKMASVGIGKVGVLDLASGEVTGAKGNFYISEELLSKIQFVREGHFSENDAAPALRLIGDLQAAEGPILQSTVKVPTSIREPEIIGSFLKREAVLSPTDFIRAICYEQTPFYPLYFYIQQMNASIADAIDLIKTLQVKGNTRDKVIARLENPDEKIQLGKIVGTSEPAAARKTLLDKLVTQTVTSEDVAKSPARFFEAVTHTSPSSCDGDYLFSLFKEIVAPLLPQLKGGTMTAFRKAICHLDLGWYKSKLA